jgi:chromosome segregation ATPase
MTMTLKPLRYGLAGAAGTLLLGGLMFGSDLLSYVSTSTGELRATVRDAVPIEFELQRARNLIDEILPEIHANVRLIAEDEVEIAALEKDIERSEGQVETDRTALARLRSKLDKSGSKFEIAGRTVTREQVTQTLAHRLARLKDDEMILASKKRLLETRRSSLTAAMQMLDGARNRKRELRQKVESLVAQHRLLRASAVGSGSRVKINDTKLSKADQLLSDIQKRLDVSERVLAHDAVPELIMEESINEADLLAEVDAHLETARSGAAVAAVED